MKLTVFGATGGIGKEIVQQALDAGHEVTAVVRDPARLPSPVTVWRCSARISPTPGRYGPPSPDATPCCPA